MTVETHTFDDDGGIPNSPLPVLVYHDALRADAAAAAYEDLFAVHGWLGAMRWDLRRGDPAEHDEVLANIARVPLPDQDPVGEAGGALVELWRGRAA